MSTGLFCPLRRGPCGPVPKDAPLPHRCRRQGVPCATVRNAAARWRKGPVALPRGPSHAIRRCTAPFDRYPPRWRHGGFPGKVSPRLPALPEKARILLRCPPSCSHGNIVPASFLRPDPPPVFPPPDLLHSGTSAPPLPGRKIVRSTSIFPAIPAPLCKEK